MDELEETSRTYDVDTKSITQLVPVVEVDFVLADVVG